MLVIPLFGSSFTFFLVRDGFLLLSDSSHPTQCMLGWFLLLLENIRICNIYSLSAGVVQISLLPQSPRIGLHVW